MGSATTIMLGLAARDFITISCSSHLTGRSINCVIDDVEVIVKGAEATIALVDIIDGDWGTDDIGISKPILLLSDVVG